jgi:hypothetical protein
MASLRSVTRADHLRLEWLVLLRAPLRCGDLRRAVLSLAEAAMAISISVLPNQCLHHRRVASARIRFVSGLTDCATGDFYSQASGAAP